MLSLRLTNQLSGINSPPRASFLRLATGINFLIFSTLFFAAFDVRGYIPAIFSLLLAYFAGLRVDWRMYRSLKLRFYFFFFCFGFYLVFLIFRLPGSNVSYAFNWLFVFLVVSVSPFLRLSRVRNLKYHVSWWLFVVSYLTVSLFLFFAAVSYWFFGINLVNPNLSSICALLQFSVLLFCRRHIFGSLSFSLLSFLVIFLSFSRSALGLSVLAFVVGFGRDFFVKLALYGLAFIGLTFSFLIFLAAIDFNIFAYIADGSLIARLLRFKGSISSDELRFFHYPRVLFSALGDSFLYGAGLGVRGYKSSLNLGEDLHSFFLVGISDIGIIGMVLFCIAAFAIFANSGSRVILLFAGFFIFSHFASFVFLGAPGLTVSLGALFVGARYLGLPSRLRSS